MKPQGDFLDSANILGHAVAAPGHPSQDEKGQACGLSH